MDSNPICTTPLQPEKWNACIWIMLNFWWLAGLVDGLEPHPPPLSSQKNEMLIFGLHSTTDDWPGWSMDSNPICHPSPAKMQNPCFWIRFNFLWLAGLVDGLEPHLPLLSSQKNEMFIFGLRSTSDDQPGWLMDLNPMQYPSPAKKMKCSFLDYVQLLLIDQAGQWTQTQSTTPLQPTKWNAHFWIPFNFWWLAGLVDGLECHPPPLCSQKNEMFIFGLCSTSDNQPGWSMDSNPIHHPSPARKMECSFLDYVQLLMIELGWLMVSNPIHHPSPARKMKCLFLDYVQLLMIGQAGWWTWTPSTTLLQPKNEMPIFGLCQLLIISLAGRWAHTPSATPLQPRKMECSFLDYVQLLMIGWAGWWTQTPSTTLLQPKKWNAHFWITFNFWWSARLVDGLEPHLPPLPSQKNEMLMLLDYIQLLMISWAGRMVSNPFHHLSPAKKTKSLHFWIMFNFWWSARLVEWTQTPSATSLHPKKWNAHFWITVQLLIISLGWLMGSHPICHPSPARKMKCLFLDYVQLLMLAGLVNALKPHLPPLSSQQNGKLIFGLRSTSDDRPLLVDGLKLYATHHSSQNS